MLHFKSAQKSDDKSSEKAATSRKEQVDNREYEATQYKFVKKGDVPKYRHLHGM